MSNLVEAINPQDVIQFAREVAPRLFVPAVLGSWAYFRARRLGGKSVESEEAKLKLAELNEQIKLVKARTKSQSDLIDIYRNMNTKSISQKSKMRGDLIAGIIDRVDPEEWKKVKGRDKEAYIEDKISKIKELSEGQQISELNKQKLAITGQVGKGLLVHNLNRAKGFISNDIKQTVEAAAIGFALNVLLISGWDALMNGLDWINTQATFIDKSVLVLDTVGIVVGALYLLKRANDVHPGK